MRDTVFLAGALLLVVLAAAVPAYPLAWRLGGGASLLALWLYGLWRAQKGALAPGSPVRLLPGHALLFLALGLVGARAALGAWLAVPPLTVALDLAPRRSLAAALYAILWLDLFALLHQVVALGRDLSGLAFLAWTVAVALVATGSVAHRARKMMKKE